MTTDEVAFARDNQYRGAVPSNISAGTAATGETDLGKQLSGERRGAECSQRDLQCIGERRDQRSLSADRAAASYLAGEFQDPQRQLPRTILLSTVGVVVLYLGLNLVYAWRCRSMT